MKERFFITFHNTCKRIKLISLSEVNESGRALAPPARHSTVRAPEICSASFAYACLRIPVCVWVFVLRSLRNCARVYARASVTRSPQFRAGAARPSACARPRPRTQQQSIKFCTGFRDIQHTLSQWIKIAQ